MIKKRDYEVVDCRPGPEGHRLTVRVSSCDLGDGFHHCLVLSDIHREKQGLEPACIYIENLEHARAIAAVIQAHIDDIEGKASDPAPEEEPLRLRPMSECPLNKLVYVMPGDQTSIIELKEFLTPCHMNMYQGWLPLILPPEPTDD